MKGRVVVRVWDYGRSAVGWLRDVHTPAAAHMQTVKRISRVAPIAHLSSAYTHTSPPQRAFHINACQLST